MPNYSHNGDFEQLVEQITDVIYARLNGDSDKALRGWLREQEAESFALSCR